MPCISVSVRICKWVKDNLQVSDDDPLKIHVLLTKVSVQKSSKKKSLGLQEIIQWLPSRFGPPRRQGARTLNQM